MQTLAGQILLRIVIGRMASYSPDSYDNPHQNGIPPFGILAELTPLLLLHYSYQCFFNGIARVVC